MGAQDTPLPTWQPPRPRPLSREEAAEAWAMVPPEEQVKILSAYDRLIATLDRLIAERPEASAATTHPSASGSGGSATRPTPRG